MPASRDGRQSWHARAGLEQALWCAYLVRVDATHASLSCIQCILHRRASCALLVSWRRLCYTAPQPCAWCRPPHTPLTSLNQPSRSSPLATTDTRPTTNTAQNTIHSKKLHFTLEINILKLITQMKIFHSKMLVENALAFLPPSCSHKMLSFFPKVTFISFFNSNSTFLSSN